MLAQSYSPPKWLSYLRLAANVVGTLFILLVFALNFLAPIEHPPPVALGDVVQLSGMLLIALGIGLAWRWSLAGGGLILLGYLVFEGVMLVEDGHIAGGLFLIFLVLAGIHLLYGWMVRSHQA